MDFRRLALLLGSAALAPVLAAACSSVESSHPDPILDTGGGTAGAPISPVAKDAGKDASGGASGTGGAGGSGGSGGSGGDAGDAGADAATGPTWAQSPCGMCVAAYCTQFLPACQMDPPCLTFYQCKMGCNIGVGKTPLCPCSDANLTQPLKDLEACMGQALVVAGPCDAQCN